MRSNALKKHDQFTQDNFKIPEELWEARRARIARASEEAANLSGNLNDPDFEEFALRYHITVTAFA